MCNIYFMTVSCREFFVYKYSVCNIFTIMYHKLLKSTLFAHLYVYECASTAGVYLGDWGRCGYLAFKLLTHDLVAD